MKYLSDYTKDAQTALFKTTGTIFAFSTKQFNEQKQENVTYVRCPAGMFCPKEHYQTLVKGLDNINALGIQRDIKENSIDGIIQRELANYEVQFTGDLSEVVATLEPYNISKEQISKGYTKFYNLCVENDWF